LCLDDLERIDESFPMKEILGFINSLVENGATKVIIITNEDAIPEASKYKELKEKVIVVIPVILSQQFRIC